MYASPGRSFQTPNKKSIPEGPISDFTTLIEETPSDRWQKRCTALRDLVDQIPDGSEYSRFSAWYNTPPILRHLAFAIGDLLKDPRSTVVKRTCESLTRLFVKCQTDARYLFKDLMPTILSVHAQTVLVIRTAVQDMVLEIIPEVPCKMVMPLWMERLKIDKSRTVREACALYLGQALVSWTEDGYLSDEIWMQVGTTLMRTLRDPSPQVRTHAKDALEHMRRMQPRCWDKLVNDENGSVSKDPKLQRWLASLGAVSPDAEELSVASKFSYNSDTRYARNTTVRSSPANKYLGGAESERVSLEERPRIPLNINVHAEMSAMPSASTRTTGATSGLGPPVRMTAPPFQQVLDSPAATGMQPPPPPPAPPAPLMAVGTPPRHPTPSSQNNKSTPRSYMLQPIEDNSPDLESASSFPSDLNDAFGKQQAVGTANVLGQHNHLVIAPTEIAELEIKPATTISDEGPFIASMQELKKHAAKRRSRNSIMMQERFRMSGSLVEDEMDDGEKEIVLGKRSEEENEVPNSEERPPTQSASRAVPVKASVSAPEHMVIAIRLLRAHKAHVDAIMETLKIEMDTLRDFDRLLEEPGRPVEEEVLDYFESVGLCLDQRTQAGAGLQREMDRISRGEPPQE